MSHDQKLQAIVLALNQHRGHTISLQKASMPHTVPHLRHHSQQKINISGLTEIISIDFRKRLAVAEASATFYDVVKATLKYGLVPYVVPELKGITLGGAVNGCSLESMSYKVGGFHDSCLEYELITGTGEIIICNRKRRPDIFELVHGAFGTLGILAKVTFKLCPAQPYVKTTYLHFNHIEPFLAAIQAEHSQPRHNFMDGIIHSPTQFVLALADFEVDLPQQPSDYNGQNIYYKSTLKKQTDYLTTLDYLFRYDRDCHWMSKRYGLENPLLRRLLGSKFLGSTNMIKTVKQHPKIFNHGKPLVTLDTMIGVSKFVQFYKWFEKTFDYFPIWIVPYHMPKAYAWFNPDFLDKGECLYIDLAIYGMPQPGNSNYYQLLEDKLLEMHGAKTLISLNNYTPESFWEIYNQPAYQKAKRQIDPANQFSDLYSKTHAIWPR